MDDALTFFQKGFHFYQRRQFNRAVEYFQKAIRADPNLLNAYINLGASLSDLGKLSAAESTFTKALELEPENEIVLYNLGLTQLHLGKLPAAKKTLERLLLINPNNSQAANDLGVVLSQQGQLDKAKLLFKQTIVKNPSADALYNLGLTHSKQGKTSLAVKYYQLAVDKNPRHARAITSLYEYYRNRCDWAKTKEFSQILNSLNSPDPGETPFINITRSDNPQDNLVIARVWSNSLYYEPVKFNYPNHHSRLKIGYATDGFRDFPTTHNLLEVLRSHNKDKYEIFAFSWGPNDKSIWRKKVIEAVDHFIEIDSLSDPETAKLINQLQIDILVDLKGHTQNNRLGIFAARPAPVQVNYLGYPGTTGAKFMDYIVADKIVIPPSAQKYYTEKVIYLPHCYRPTDTRFKIHPPPLQPSRSFIFASFNSSYKIEEAMFKAWLNILKRTAKTVLWIWVEDNPVRQKLTAYTKKYGVDPARITYIHEMDKPQHLARLSRANLALDTYPTNGHTTTVDCLWAGVPVITMAGRNFASRVSSSALTAASLPQLITKNLKSYADLAVELAAHPDRLPPVDKQSILFDTKSYTRDLEKAFQKLWTMR